MFKDLALRKMRRAATCLLSLLLVLTIAAPVFSHASVTKQGTKPSQPKTVRVGWFNSTFFKEDEFGRKSGYAYDYQQKIAAYTGWKYEYVEASWPELMDMLSEGKIDLLSDVSYTDERARSMLFSTIPMGTESYYVFVYGDESGINPEDITSFNGKTIGVNEGSVQVECLKDWMKTQNIHPQIRESSLPREAQQQMLVDGKIDALATPNIYTGEAGFVPVCKIGASDFYFAVSKEREDLLTELNAAMNRIQEESRFYNQDLWDKYFSDNSAKTYLTTGEKEWLAAHGPIRLGYVDQYLPFCESGKNGRMKGGLNNLLAMAAEDAENADLRFKAVPCPDAEAALEALKRGEVDCVFPCGLSASDGEREGIMMTKPLLQTEMYAVIRRKDRRRVLPRENFRVAVCSNNPNQKVFVESNFPKWEIVQEKNEKACVEAVESERADATLVSHHRALVRDDLRENGELETLVTGKSMPLAFAVNREDSDLYAILGKTLGRISTASIESAIEPYASYEEKVSLGAFLRDYWMAVLIITTAFFVFILFELVMRLRAEKKAHERQKLIAATEWDRLTGLYNRAFFFEYANRMYLDNPSFPMDAISLDIDQFHSLNALNGRDFGDQVLKHLAEEIRSFLEGKVGLAGRLEADHFAIYCAHMTNYEELFARFQDSLLAFDRSANIRLRMGVMSWQRGEDPILLFDQASTACSMARGDYKTRLVIFDEEVRQRENYEQRLLNDLHRALEDREFLVYYQPKYNIRGETPMLSSAEALVRWRHPELGMIPPGDFIPLLENRGLITDLDKYVWEEAARQIAVWRERCGVTVPVSVNLSRVDVFDPALEETLDGILATNGLGQEAFKLEVTESAYTENADQVIQVIEGLRQKGYEIEMDDFGTGYSSLNMLSSMPVDVLKMDRGFIMNIEQEEKDIRLVELILDIAENLHVPVIAEGVETESQMKLLKELGCDVIQGYYFSRPLPADEFEEKIIRKV